MTTSIADFVLPAASKQYLRVPISATIGGVAVDPSADVVQLACVPPGQAPVFSDFVTGSWEAGTPMLARVLIGPGTNLVLAKGAYEVYVKVTDNPEIPVLNSGLLEVTP